MAVEAETVEFINCNNKEYEICDAKAREKFDAIDNLKDMAYEEKINYPTVTDLNNAVVNLQRNFQAGVDAIGDACERKGSTPASSSLEDTVAAIDAIQTGGNYATLEVNEDGTYTAAEDPRGIDAYDIVVVSKDVGQPHTVVFYDSEGNIIKTQANVPYHGYASCNLLDGTMNGSLYFKGQNPIPNNIIRDTFCYPQYGDYIIRPNEIEDDQETICANKGASYPLGSYKPLIISIPQHTYEVEFNNAHSGELKERAFYVENIGATVQMVKVAEGEDGSASTWLSEDYIAITANNHAVQGNPPNYINDVYSRDDNYANEMQFDQGNSFIREQMNDKLLSSLPLCLQDSIQTVNKYYKGYSSYDFATISFVLAEKSSLDKIWVPSVKELSSLLSTYDFNNSYNAYGGLLSDYTEINGIDYSSIFTPIYVDHNFSSYITLRTSAGLIVRRYDPGILRFLRPNNIQTNPKIEVGVSTGFANTPFGFCL